MPPSCLLLDLGGVLVEFDHRDTCRALARPAGLGVEEVYSRLFTSGLEKDLDEGRITPGDFWERVREVLGAPDLDDATIERAWAEIFTRSEENLALLAGLSRSFRLVLVSNTNIPHLRYIDALAPELGRDLHARVLSYEVGERKPAARFYARALDVAGVDPARCLFVDDSRANLRGARAAGIPTAHHAPGTSLAATLAAAGVPLPGGS